MKRIVCFFMLMGVSFLYAKDFSFIPYTRLGILAVGPSGADLGYIDAFSGETYLDEFNSKSNIFSYGFGSLFLWPFGKNAIGIDIGVFQVYHLFVDTSYHPPVCTFEENYIFANALVLMEVKIGHQLFSQLGAGMYIKKWDFHHIGEYGYAYLDENYTLNEFYTKFGFSGSLGIDIPLASHMEFFMAGRLDLIFDWGFIAPIAIIAGVRL
jgi:hypothetical protein